MIPLFQTIITKLTECLEYQDGENFVQTKHDTAIADFIQTAIDNKCQIAPGGVTTQITNEYLVTIIMYIESEKLPKIETLKNGLYVPAPPRE